MSDLLAAVAPAPEPAAPQGKPGGDAPPGEPFAPVLEAAALQAEAPPGSPPAGDTVRTADAEDAAGSDSSGTAAQIAVPVTGQPVQVATPQTVVSAPPAGAAETGQPAVAPTIAAPVAAPVEQPPVVAAPAETTPVPAAAQASAPVDPAPAGATAAPAAAAAVTSTAATAPAATSAAPAGEPALPPVAAFVDAAAARPAATPGAPLAVEENAVHEAPVVRPATAPAPTAPVRPEDAAVPAAPSAPVTTTAPAGAQPQTAAAQTNASQTVRPEGAAPAESTGPDAAPAPAEAASADAPPAAATQNRPQGSGPDQHHERPREATPAQGVQAPAQAAAESTAPVAQPAEPTELEQPVRSARLHDLPQAVAATIRVASRADGQTVARIVLRPEELGEVRIRLDVGAQGVHAHVVADSPEAAAALHAALGELRRSLESQGLSVLGLDVRHATPDEQRRSFAGLHGESGGRSHQGDDAPSDGRAADDEVTLDPTRLPFHGSRVDVLA